MKRILFSAALLLITSASAFAQQALWGQNAIVSPEIHADNTVTFRLHAPGATQVQITSDFVPTQKIDTPFGQMDVAGAVDLTRNDQGVWEWTTPEPLAPELYSYTFLVDGLKITDPSNVFQIRDTNSITNVFIIGGDYADLYRVQDVPHGTLAKVWYHSDVLGTDRRLTVYTPAGYESGTETYPVFYLLHGMGGDENAWSELGRTAQIMDNLIAQGKAKPMIVVMTNGNVDQQAAPGEGPNGFVQPTTALARTMDGSFETHFPDVVAFVDGTYRTRPEKASRAIAGLSMGGFHSLHISKEYPDLFDYIGLFSAAILPGQQATSSVYQDMEAKLKVQFDRKPALYYIAIGNADFLYEANKAYRAQLDAAGYPYVYKETEQGHIWKNWRIYLSDFAPRLFK